MSEHKEHALWVMWTIIGILALIGSTWLFVIIPMSKFLLKVIKVLLSLVMVCIFVGLATNVWPYWKDVLKGKKGG